MRTLMTILSLALLASLAMGDVLVEKHSKTEFPASITLRGPEGPIELKALGTGIRKAYVVAKVYAGCFYVDATADLGEDPASAAIHGDFAKRIDMHFLRDVGAEKIAGAFREDLHKRLEDRDESIETFCGLFTEKVKKNESIVLSYLPGTGLIVEQAERELGKVEDPDLIAAIWAIWFDEEPISEDLKKGLLGL